MENLSKPFKIACAIENAACYERFEKGQRRQYIVGRASGTKVDRDHERVAESALLSIQKAIEDGLIHEDGTVRPIPLMSEHEKGWDDELGVLTKAWIDDQWDLWIEAELDFDNPRSHFLYTKLSKNEKQYGLSIGGYVLEAGYEWNDELHKNVRVFYNVGLNEVSVTSRPAYPTAYLNALTKSVSWDGVRTERQIVVTEEIMKSFNKTEQAELAPTDDVEKSAVDPTEAEEIVKAEAEEAEQVEVEAAAEEAEVAEKSEAEEEAEDVVAKNEDAAEDAEDTVEKAEAEAEEADRVEKAEAEQDGEEVVEKAATTVRVSMETWADAWEGDPLGALRQAVESIMDEVNALKDVLKSTNEAPVEDAVEKSDAVETEADEAVEKTANEDQSADVVEKSGTAPFEDVVAKALTDVLGEVLDEKLAPVAKAIGTIEARLTELESQEVDGSISVSKAIGNTPNDNEDPREQLEKTLASMPTAGDRIAYLLRLQNQSR